jgi:hypothetical protein
MQMATMGRRRFLVSGAAAITAGGAFLHHGRAASLASEEQSSAYLTWLDLVRTGWIFEHWTPEGNGAWTWYRLERFVDGDWLTIGLTTPVSTDSDETVILEDGYLDNAQVPLYVVMGQLPRIPTELAGLLEPSQYDASSAHAHVPDATRRSSQGKPPSVWLRSLFASELREWLPTIEVPPATVRDMTFWTHLVRDHGFDPLRIEGLNEFEFFQLHSAAHHGY